MKVAIAIDSLKGSLSLIEAGNAIMKGIKFAWANEALSLRPPLAASGVAALFL